MNWKDVQIICLQKMFEIQGDTLVVDDSTESYIKMMPGACNEALGILATAGKFLRKTVEIKQEISAGIAMSTNSRPSSGEAAEQGILYGNGLAVFSGGKEITSSARNSMKASFPAGRFNAYDLRELCGDFYSLYQGEIFFDDGTNYDTARDYRMEGDSILLLDKNTVGRWKVWYNAYPETITKDTPGDHDLGLDPEVAGMVALYMAGQLSKEDDVQRAQLYMNEFATWLEELKRAARRSKSPGGGRFTSVTGW